ncbi:MAG: hypothetical protein KJ674_00370 [Nanoarchaeota archaeon]|nr:hypothetical protein [Nanoarchaeota archaeon]
MSLHNVSHIPKVSKNYIKAEDDPNLIIRVNNLLKTAFGLTARGNMELSYPGHATDMFSKTDHLDLITRFYIFPSLIGKFDDEIGSKITVLPKWEERASIYRVMFATHYNMETNLNVSDAIIDTGNWSYEYQNLP